MLAYQQAYLVTSQLEGPDNWIISGRYLAEKTTVRNDGIHRILSKCLTHNKVIFINYKPLGVLSQEGYLKLIL